MFCEAPLLLRRVFCLATDVNVSELRRSGEADIAVNKGQRIVSDISVKNPFLLWLTLSDIDSPPS